MPIKKEVPTFHPDTYAKLTQIDLVVFVVQFVQGQTTELLPDDVVAVCFQMFPERFSLRTYPHWPDSAVVGRRLTDLRTKRYLSGSAARGFKLTSKGARRAATVGKMLGKPIRIPSRVEAKAGHDSRFVKAVEASDAFHHFKLQRSKVHINEYDFRSMLLCTMESPPATLARNLQQFKENVRASGRKDLYTFLEFCEAKFSHLLVDAPQRVLLR